MTVMEKDVFLAQFLILCAVRFSDPLVFTQIFPYINQLLASLHLLDDPANIGFYSGLVESTFAFFQLCTVYHCARLSDIVGRRPVIIFSVFGLAISTILLGFASSLPLILLSRALAGIFSGDAAVLHSVVGEITTPANESFAFSMYGLFWPLGSIIGPIVGGALADPAQYYPRVRFFQHAFFKEYPYFLPCFATGFFVFLLGCIATKLFHETLPSKRTYPEPIAPASDPPPVRHGPPLSLPQLLRIPAIRALTLSGSALCFTATAFDALFVLFCYTSVPLGGLGFTAHQIATCLALAGTSSILLQVFLLPTLLKRINHARLYIICMLFWPATYAVLPLLNVIVRHGVVLRGLVLHVNDAGTGAYNSYDRDTHGQEVMGSFLKGGVGIQDHIAGPQMSALTAWTLWTGIICIMAMSRVGCLAYSVSLVLVKQAAPHASLGKANGAVLWGMCLSRACAPALSSALFAFAIGQARGVLGGRGWVVVMVLVAIGGAWVSRGVGEADPGRRGSEGASGGEGDGGGEESEDGGRERDVEGGGWAGGVDVNSRARALRMEDDVGIVRRAGLGVEEGEREGLLAGADFGADVYADEEGGGE